MNRDPAAEPSREDLLAVIAAQAAQIAALTARIAELERRLGLDSSNSGKPPSSDGLKKPVRVRSLRQPSGAPPGGRKGHPGDTLRQAEFPDVVEDHYPPACAGCGAALTAAMASGHAARQVFDLPKPRPPVVTEHRAHECCCAGCGERTKAAFPAGVTAPVQYGPRISAIAVYLLHSQFVPEDRVAEMMRDLFGARLVAATVAQMSRTCADRLRGLVHAVCDHVAAAEVKHLDETGFRIGGQTRWLHVASTALLTMYRVSDRRGLVWDNVTGIAVHDHWKPYYTMTGVLHALCNAHHLRELKALIEIDKEDWARQMQIVLRRACHVANLANAQGVSLKPRFIARIERRYDAVVAAGLAFHMSLPRLPRAQRRGWKPRRVGHNLLARLQLRRDDVLRFLHDPQVPFTNNQAERDIRMMKLRQKISGGFRSFAGAEIFAVIRSVLSTARKQGWDLVSTLMLPAETLLRALKIA
jgi:transposase